MLKAALTLIGIIAILLSSMAVQYSWASTSPAFSTQWGTYGLQNTGQFAFPQGVTVDSSGNVYVTDLGNRRIEKFDNSGTFLFTWGTKGSGNGQFQAPIGIAMSHDSFYVVDNELNNVQKFDLTGKYVTQWGTQGGDHGQFLLPQGIAVDPSGDVYVVDTGNSRIEKFDSNGKYLLTFGSSGLEDGQFLSPRGIAADSQGSIYVADSGNNRIQKFTEDGTFTQSYGVTSGVGLKTPIGLSVDKSGNIFVADTGNNRIVELDSNGHVLTSWGSQGKGADFFDNPRDVAVDPAGNVFVVDTQNNRIQKFGSNPIETQTTQTTNQTQTTQTTQVIDNQTQVPKITDPNDKTPPIITAPSDITAEATGMLTTVSIGQATATDDSGIASITSNAPQKFPLGTTMVTWAATDNGGNVVKAIQKVTVIDTTAPVLTAPPPITMEAKSPDHNSIDLGLPSVNDAVGVESVANDAPPYFLIGQTTVTWTAKDASGNTATTKQLITVKDTTPPVIHAPQDIVQEATSATNNIVDLGNATVTDNGEIKSVTNNSPASFSIGKTTVTWTAKDASGNSASAIQIITINDTTAPKIIPPKDVVFEATSLDNNVVSIGNATVTDNGEIKSITNDMPKEFPLGITTVTWTATDKAGNKANATQTVDVVDTTAPKITPPKDVVFEATSLDNNTVSIGNATALDIEPITITNNASKTFALGKSVILWTATDKAGNKANATQTVDVVDTTAPKITPPKDVVFEATSLDNNTVSIGTPTVTDLQQVTVTNDAPKGFTLGITTVTWTATDTAGNKANSTQTVTVKDTTAPSLVIPNDISIEATSLKENKVNIGKANATDSVGVASITNDAPQVFPIGKTVFTWTATDKAGNKANATQTVEVIDTTAPKITAPADVKVEATSLADNTISIGNATALDIEPITITNNASKTFALGKSVILWTATDKAGNKANATQTVEVIDTTAPKITPPKDVVFEATSLDNNTVSIGNATATDLIKLESITSNASKTFALGKSVILWTAKDASGNTANATQTVDVVHTIPPKITPPKDIKIEAVSLNNNTVSLGNPIITDIEQVTITNNAPTTFQLGLTTVTWTAKDASGNTANATQTVEVIDTTTPKITAPADVKVEATSLADNTISIGNATALDIEPITITNNASKTFALGKSVILWTATDKAGNKANATQTVEVIDTTAPKITAPADVKVEATSLADNTISIGNATALDIEPITITNNASKTFALGKSVILWTATDKAGNKANATQTVDVVDTTAPKIIPPKNITINATSSTDNHVDIGNATISDAVKVASLTNNAPATFPFGNTTVTWTATDEVGNKATSTQIIQVIDRTPPNLVIPSDVIVNATAFTTPITLGQATATGIIDGSPKITNNATSQFPIGKTIVEWTAVDKFGNTKTLTQTVTVLACGKPESAYNLMMGTSGDDTLTGSVVSNLIIGLTGNDIIHAGPAGDCIIAGNNDNIIFGGNGNDIIIAGDGNNVIKTGTGNAEIHVGDGSNIIQGGTGHNTCYLGNPSKDTVVNCESKLQ